jgi:uracil-DNA glycosylase
MKLVKVGDFELLVPDVSVFNFKVPEGWEIPFCSNHEAINKILDNCKRRGRFFPYECDIFNAFHACPLYNVKVVIRGMDPYPNTAVVNGETVPQACGMSFAVRRGIKPPGSLLNIYKRIKKDYPNFVIPDHGDLTAWAKQGILLMNSCLTYFPDNPLKGAALKCWAPFNSRIDMAICEANPKVIYVLWGKEAQQSVRITDKITRLEGVHPSPMNGNKFIDTVDHFPRINEILRGLGQDEINYDLV